MVHHLPGRGYSYFVVVDDDSTGVFRFTETADDHTVTAAELTTVATIDTTITGDNLLFA